MAKEECSIESHFCIKDVMLCECVCSKGQKREDKQKNLNQQYSCDQFNSTTTKYSQSDELSKYTKKLYEKNHIIRDFIKT